MSGFVHSCSNVVKPAMQRILPVLVGVLVICSGVVAAVAYELVMSKDNSVCNKMLKVFNDSLVEHGKVLYVPRELFVKWEPIDLDRGPYAKQCSIWKRAQFDIDNDRHDELVIKYSGCLRDQLSDSLYIFDSAEGVIDKMRNKDSKALETQDKLALTGKGYELRELPKQAGSAPSTIGGVFRLNAFLFQNTAFLSMTDLREDWLVIGKYKHANQLEDVCYLHRDSTSGS